MQQTLKLGIMGGLGPAASAQLLARITDLTLAETDQDHLDVVMLSYPHIPDRTAYLLKEEGAPSFIEPMQDMARELESLKCKIIACPCNTAHAQEEDLKAPLKSAEFLSMVNLVVQLLDSASIDCVGMMATDGTCKVGIYDKVCNRQGIKVVNPDPEDQQLVMDVIYKYVKTGNTSNAPSLAPVMKNLKDQGAQAMILGCTELSMLGLGSAFEGMPIVDTIDVLAIGCIEACNAKVNEVQAAKLFDKQILDEALNLKGSI